MNSENRTLYTVRCRMCQKAFPLQIDHKDIMKWENGELAQNAFPYLDKDERELLISRTCGKCFDDMFAD